MWLTIRRHRVKQVGALLLMGLLCGGLLCFPQAAAAGASRGLSVCGNLLIPSLFPFLVLTGLFIRSGLSAKLGRRLDRWTRRLFGLPGSCGGALLVGAVGGYPAGAAAVKDLLSRGEIDRSEAKRLLHFCVNGGPAFIIGTVGAGLLGNIYKGILLYISHLTASFLIGCFERKRGQVFESPARPVPARQESLQKSFVDAVSGGMGALLSMCGFVVLFSSLLSLAEAAGIISVLAKTFTHIGVNPGLFTALFAAFWEVSGGCVEVAGHISGWGLPLLLGMAMGWGGLSVSCQIGGLFSEEHLLDRGYWRARLWHALLGGALSLLLFRLVRVPTVGTAAPVWATLSVPPTFEPVSISVLSSVTLLLMCGALLFGVSVRE